MCSRQTSPHRPGTASAIIGHRKGPPRAGGTGLFALGACLLLATPAFSQEAPDVKAMIMDALRAAPPSIRETAAVSDLEGNILREGSSDYVCYPAPADIAGPMCMDAEWRRWMKAWMEKAPFTAERVAIAYMLAGDMPGGGASNIDPAASTPTADNQWVVEGPHIMVISPDPAAYAGLPTTPDTDGPYVMWQGTPYVHLMVPVAERPEQRSIP